MGHVGDVIGEVLAKVVTDLVSRSGANVDESLAVVATGRAAWRSEVETASATITMRAIPLTLGGVRTGAMVLLRDVSELRRREQELLTKDATIREIHHRVKNNLQTVAALLRLQARRVTDDAARASLEEAVRRVGTIALVHETLSQGFDETVNFDEIAVRGLRAVVEVATREHRVESTFTGSFGRMRAEDATALAMIVSELVQNAVEHGLADRDGKVEVAVTRQTLDERRGAADRGHHRRRRGPARRVPARRSPGSGRGSSPRWRPTCKGRIRWENNEPQRHAGRVRGAAAAAALAVGLSGRRRGVMVAGVRPRVPGRACGSPARRGRACGAGSAGATGAGVAALEGAALVLGHAAPDTGVLAGLDGPLQAGVDHLTPAADGLGLLDLSDRRAGVPNREEQLGVLVEAGSAVAPVHEGCSLSRGYAVGRAPAGGGADARWMRRCSRERTSTAQTSVTPHYRAVPIREEHGL